MVKKDNCVIRESARFNNPPVSYTTVSCDAETILDVDKATSDYFTIKILNKQKI